MNFGGFRWIRWTSGVPLNLPLNLSFLVYINVCSTVRMFADDCLLSYKILSNRTWHKHTPSRPWLDSLQDCRNGKRTGWWSSILSSVRPSPLQDPSQQFPFHLSAGLPYVLFFIICTVFIRSYCSLSAARLIQYTSAYSLVVRYCSESSRHRKWRWLCNRSANPRILKLLRPLFVDIRRNALWGATSAVVCWCGCVRFWIDNTVNYYLSQSAVLHHAFFIFRSVVVRMAASDCWRGCN